MFGQPVKVALKTSDAIEDIFTEEELQRVVSGKHGEEQVNPVKEIHVGTPNGTSND